MRERLRQRWVIGMAMGALTLALGACKEKGGDGAAAADGGGGQDNQQAEQALVQAMADSTQWPSYGRDQTNERYSPLTQVNTGNVAQLQPVWTYHTGVSEAFEDSPVVVNGVMYVTTALDHVIALDAATGQKKWEYVHQFDGPTVHCCGPVNRGVAYYGGRVYLGTLDAQLVALDAATGNKAWSQRVDDNNRGYSITMAPIAADGKILIGVAGAEYGIRGHLDAYDARTGSHVWRWYAIPAPGEAPNGWWGSWSTTDAFGTVVHKDRTAERRDSAKYPDAWKTGGGSVWQAPTVDRQLGLVFQNVGNASPDLNGAVRPGDNLYTNSIVAVGLADGKYRWHFQEIPHDVWDLDTTSPTVLFDVQDSSGQTIPAIAQAGKTGWVYILDRRNGKPIRRSDAFVPQQNMYAQPTAQGTLMLPGANGGSEWSPTAYSPQTGYMYVLGLHQPMLYKVADETLNPPSMWLGGAFIGVGAQGGIFSAVDTRTGKIAWQNHYPDPMIGGAMATAGGLVFYGTKDQRFIAADAKTGKELWTYRAAAGVNAPPISYMLNGRQYVAVAAGGNYQINAPRGDEVLVFALGTGAQPGAGSAAQPGATTTGATPPPATTASSAAAADTSRRGRS